MAVYGSIQNIISTLDATLKHWVAAESIDQTLSMEEATARVAGQLPALLEENGIKLLRGDLLQSVENKIAAFEQSHPQAFKHYKELFKIIKETVNE